MGLYFFLDIECNIIACHSLELHLECRVLACGILCILPIDEIHEKKFADIDLQNYMYTLLTMIEFNVKSTLRSSHSAPRTLLK